MLRINVCALNHSQAYADTTASLMSVDLKRRRAQRGGMRPQLAVVGVAAAWLCAGVVVGQASPPAAFHLLVQQWPASFCATAHCTRAAPATFTVHGLWPNYADGSYPSFCPGPAFDDAKLGELKAEMEQVWPSLTQGDDSFWGHEWTKHGTCAQPALTDEHSYFAAALRKRDGLDLLGALKTAGIEPSATPVDTDSVKAALSAAVGKDVLVHCHSGSAAAPRAAGPADKVSYLSEVWVCYTNTPSLDVMECPHTVVDTCGSTLVIPPAP